VFARRCSGWEDGLNPRLALRPRCRVPLADVKESSEAAAKRVAAEVDFMLARVAQHESFGAPGWSKLRAENGEGRPTCVYVQLSTTKAGDLLYSGAEQVPKMRKGG
jgi:hypothetical protein